MRSSFRRAPAIRSVLTSIALGAMLCACVMHTVTAPNAVQCGQLIKAAHLLDPTPGTRLPIDDSKGEWVAFGDRQTGQLDKSNADKAGAAEMLELCISMQAAVDKQLKRKRVLGLF